MSNVHPYRDPPTFTQPDPVRAAKARAIDVVADAIRDLTAHLIANEIDVEDYGSALESLRDTFAVIDAGGEDEDDDD